MSARFAVSDRVVGMMHGMNKLQPNFGAFSENVGSCAAVLLKLPSHTRLEEAACLWLEGATAAVGLSTELRLPASLEQLRAPAGVGGEGKDLQD